MCSELKYINNFEIKQTIISKFCCEISEDEFISITTDKGVVICKLIPADSLTLNTVFYNKYFIKSSEYCLTNHLEINVDSLVGSLAQDDFVECILRSDTSITIENCEKNQFGCIASKWSPKGLIGEQCILAVLNDSGSLDLYTKIFNNCILVNFEHILNLTELTLEIFKNELKDTTNMSKQESYKEIKRRLDFFTPTVFTWTQLINNYSLLIVAMRNGRIMFWKINYVDVPNYKSLKVDLLGFYNAPFTNFTAMDWVGTNTNGILYIGCKSGILIALPTRIVNDKEIKFDQIVDLSEKDDLRVDKILTALKNDYLFIYVIKQTFITIYAISSNGEFIDSCNYFVGNLSIIGCQYIVDKYLLILTHTGVIKELNVDVKDKKIKIDWKIIYISNNWSLEKALGLFVSKNNIFFSLLTEQCTPVNSKHMKNMFLVKYFLNRKENIVDMLLNNKSNSLMDYSDCLEGIRISALYFKAKPCSLLPTDTDYDNLNLYQLKCYLFISKISEYIYDQMETLSKLNVKPSFEIQTSIDIKLAVYYIQKIIKNFNNGTEFHKKSIKSLLLFLKELILQDSITTFNLGNNITEELFDVITKLDELDLSDEKIVCIICESDLIGSFCMNQHIDNRCLLTRLQIVNGSYVCSCCKRYVYEEALDEFEIKLCPYCDMPFDIVLSNLNPKQPISATDTVENE